MSQWLGIGVLALFSLGLSLFMRLERKPQPQPPEHLRRWGRVASMPDGATYVERRVVELPRRGFGRSRWVEQRRVRRASDDAILEVLGEQPFRPNRPVE